MTHSKGDLAVAATIKDLTLKGYNVFVPAVAGHLRYDLIAELGGVCYRIQAKYSANGLVSSGTISANCTKVSVRPYQAGDFDYYAVYLPSIDKVIYPSIKFAGCYIRAELPTTPCSYWWHEDFAHLTDVATKRTLAGVRHDLNRAPKQEKPAALPPLPDPSARPTKEELQQLIWSMPVSEVAQMYGVSRAAVIKWTTKYELDRPGRGHWQKKYGQWKNGEVA